MLEIGKNIGKVDLQGLGCCHDGLQARMRRPKVPTSKKRLSAFWVMKSPQSPKGLLDCPCPPSFQMGPTDSIKLRLTPLWDLFLVIQPEMLGPFQPVVAYGTQHFVLGPAYLVDCLRNSPHNVELVENNLTCCVRNISLSSSNVRIPHVHGYRLDAAELFGGELTKVLLQAFLSPIVSYVLDRSLFVVANKSFVTVTLGKCLLIDAQPGRNPSLLAGQAPSDGLLHDMPCRIPADPSQTLGSRNIAFFEGVDYPALKKIRDRQARTGPAGLDLTYAMRGTLYPRQARMDVSQAVTRVQMPPVRFFCMVIYWCRRGTFRTVSFRSGIMFQPNIHALGSEIQLYFTNMPRLGQSQQGCVQFCIFHLGFLSIWKSEDTTLSACYYQNNTWHEKKLVVGLMVAVEIAQRFPRACGIPQEFQAIVDPAVSDPHERQDRQPPRGWIHNKYAIAA
jgi:hypothetical protein